MMQIAAAAVVEIMWRLLLWARGRGGMLRLASLPKTTFHCVNPDDGSVSAETKKEQHNGNERLSIIHFRFLHFPVS